MDVAATWAMIGGMGLYQGLNPPMGWLPALQSGLFSGKIRSLISRLVAASFGHLLAMMVVLVPLATLLSFRLVTPTLLRDILAIFLTVFGLYKLCRPIHPAFLARISPGKPIKWSFLMALTHCGSPFMMATSLLALITVSRAKVHIIFAPFGPLFVDVSIAMIVPVAMILPLLGTSCVVAFVLYQRRELKAVTRFWFNFDIGWAISMIIMGQMAWWMGKMAM